MHNGEILLYENTLLLKKKNHQHYLDTKTTAKKMQNNNFTEEWISCNGKVSEICEYCTPYSRFFNKVFAGALSNKPNRYQGCPHESLQKRELISNPFFCIFQAIQTCVSQASSLKTLQHQQTKTLNSPKINPKFLKNLPLPSGRSRRHGEALLWSVKKLTGRPQQALQLLSGHSTGCSGSVLAAPEYRCCWY